MLISIPAVLFPHDFTAASGGRGGKQHQSCLGVLVQGLGRKLVHEDTRLPAFMALQKIADVLGGPKHFHSYISRFNSEQRAIYDELSCTRKGAVTAAAMTPDPMSIVVGRKLSGRASPYNLKV